MNRKSLIISLAAIGAMMLAVVVALVVLYHDGDKEVPVEGRYELLRAIPSNAVAVGCLSHVGDLASPAFSGFKFTSELSDAAAEGLFGKLSEAPMAFSFHYSGKLAPLMVFDAGAASLDSPSDVDALVEFGRSHGMHVDIIEDCSYVVMAQTETLVKSSVRHFEQSLSVLGAPGFAEVSSAVKGTDLFFISYSQMKPLFTSVFSRDYFKEKYQDKANAAYSSRADWAATMADWAAFSIGEAESAPLALTGVQTLNGTPAEFMNVLASSAEAVSTVSEILPSYVYFALSLPMAGEEGYVEAYKAYLDSKQQLPEYNKQQTQLQKETKMSPELYIKKLGVREVATASFGTAKNPLEVNLVKMGKNDTVVFRGTDITSFKGYEPKVHEYAFGGYVASVFGKFFQLEDESYFTVINGWLVSGSKAAVEEYCSGRATEYTLNQYMADAGKEDLLAVRSSSLVSYLNLGSASGLLPKVLTKDVNAALISIASGAEFRPMVMTAYKKGRNIATDLAVYDLKLQRVKAPEFERDTVVVVPKGPFKVKNSGTGKMNLFYQNSSGAICLKEENGTGLWGVPFGKPLCGTAHTIDYFANGKLQILFGSESKIYLIDRLGRFVSGFPIDIKKDILLGPDVYDFNGAKAYNIMVLHKDNTIEMYNLKGQQPASWKGITAEEKIKGLPERIEVTGNTFWVVRTSIQTLIFPFAGGEPLTKFTGQQMILPTSRVDIVDEASVQVECYDGKIRTVKLK